MIIKANIVEDDRVYLAEIEFNQSIQTIREISAEDINHDYLLPGFIDLHIHGGGGSDIMQGEHGIRNVLRTHLGRGTTSLLATTVTASMSELESVFQDIATIIKSPNENEAQIIGVHLEGPYISKEKIGAQPECTKAFNLSDIKKLHNITPIKVITFAPESGAKDEDLKILKEMGIILQLGHSNIDYQVAKNLLENDIDSVTHLYNAMSSFHHRKPGLAGATLAHGTRAEIIPDLIHVHPGAIKVALRSIPDLYFVTDATAASGMPDGEYKLGSHTVHKCPNGVRLKDGTLAGSSLCMNQALKNAKELGLSISEASRRLSSIQAQLLGMKDRGHIKEGYRSDLVLVDTNMDLKSVFLKGQRII